MVLRARGDLKVEHDAFSIIFNQFDGSATDSITEMQLLEDQLEKMELEDELEEIIDAEKRSRRGRERNTEQARRQKNLHSIKNYFFFQ